MSADTNPIEYWTPDSQPPAHAAGAGRGPSMFTGPQRVGCATMLAITVLASALAVGIVTALGWVLA